MGKIPFKALIKISISATMLFILLSFVKKHDLLAVCASTPLWLIPGIALGYIISQFISAWRWHLVLRFGGIRRKFTNVLSAHLVGVYMNVFGFGTVGGDLGKAMLVGGVKQAGIEAVASVAADRLIGMAVLAAIGLVFAAFVPEAKVFWQYGLVPVLLVLGTAAGLAGVVFLRRILRRASSAWARKLNDALRMAPSSPSQIGAVIAVALLFHFEQIVLFWLMTYAVGTPIPLRYLLATIPAVNILSTLPISWMGVGVRETLYVLFFAPRYLDEPQALLFGGIWLAGMVVAAGFGGLVSLWRIDDLNVLTRQQASELEAMAAELDLQQPLTSSAAAKK